MICICFISKLYFCRHWENDDDINDEDGDPELCDDVAEQLVLGQTGSQIKVSVWVVLVAK